MSPFKSKIAKSCSLVVLGAMLGAAGLVGLYAAMRPAAASQASKLTADALFQPRLLQFAETNPAAADTMAVLRHLWLTQSADQPVQITQNLCHRWAPDTQPLAAGASPCLTDGRYGSEVAQALSNILYDLHTEADIVLSNGGTVRGDLRVGPLSQQVLKQVFPFNNPLVVVTISGRALKEALEGGLSAYFDQAQPGAYPYTSGLRFHVNAGDATNHRLAHMEVKDRSDGSWHPLDDKKIYRLLTNQYLTAGKDGYQALLGLTAKPPRILLGSIDSVLFQTRLIGKLDPIDPADYSTQSIDKK